MELTTNCLLSINCMTYNQSSYISDAMNGFAMQQTDFPFLAVIVDDASTDGEQDVIQNYVEEHFDHSQESSFKEWETEDAFWTFARHKENTNCHFLVVYLKKNLYKTPRKDELIAEWCVAKYIAICEGDDYWTDPLKLQKQVDFMEAHNDYSMCFHKVNVKSDVGEEHIYDHLEEKDYTGREIYDKWTVPTCSVLYKNDRPLETHPSVFYGDIFMFLQLSERGKLHCLGFVGGVYRRYSSGISYGYSTQNCVRLYHQYRYFQKRFPRFCDISIRNQEQQLEGIIHAPYFPKIWKYRIRYMVIHPHLFFSSFATTTILSYTPIRNCKFWKTTGFNHD